MQILKQNEIRPIRRVIGGRGSFSLTSYKFQDDILSFILENQARGDCVIEVGCFYGGLSAQIAHIAQKIGKALYIVDVSETCLAKARETVEAIAPKADVYYHCGSFASFVAEQLNQIKPIVVFIDGDHTFEGVTADIYSLYQMQPMPHAAVFHDFALRVPTADYLAGVKEAIYATLGQDFIHTPFGEIAGEGSTIHTENNPGEDGHYHLSGFPEAVMILCSRCSPKSPSIRNVSSCH